MFFSVRVYLVIVRIYFKRINKNIGIDISWYMGVNCDFFELIKKIK